MPHALVNTRAIWDAEEKICGLSTRSCVRSGTNLCSLINESNDTLSIASISERSHCINKSVEIILMYYDLPVLFVCYAIATPSTVINRSANGKYR